MRKSGLADSPFFAAARTRRPSPPLLDKTPVPRKRDGKEDRSGEPQTARRPHNRGTTTPRDHDTATPRYDDTTIEAIRKAVKQFGKEAATHRFTSDEKKAIADIIYAYRNQGIRTSENEIARIAINFITKDYRRDTKGSILDRALKALNE